MARQMKDSGIEWIGEIPADWKTVKIKQLQDLSVENSFIDGDWIESPYITDTGIRYLTTGNVGDGHFKEQGNGYISEETFRELNCKYAYPDDFVIARLNAPYGRACILPATHPRYVLAVDIVILRTEANKRYLCYVTQCEGYQRAVQDEAKGTTMKRISRTNLGNIVLPIAPLDEQHRIAAFLDRKCAEIDAVIERTKATIEEYKKLKQAVITEAVTKGVRGARKMKDSGIEWIGEICDTYQVYRLKHLVNESLMYGANESGIPFEANLPRYIRITDITLDGHLKDDGKLSLSESAAEPYILKNNDILFARSGATVGKAFIYKQEYGRAAFAGYLIKASVNESVCADYLFCYTQSSLYEEWKKQIFVQATIQNIGADRYNNLPVVLPDIDEQKEIVAYLDEKCAALDILIAKKTALLTELETYKKSLIYEYVTGKKEV